MPQYRVDYSERGFVWIDLVNPTKKELEVLAVEYKLHPSQVRACLDPEHLPKLERVGGVDFLIVRAFDEKCSNEADSVQELTRKLAIFFTGQFLISVHRKDQPYIADLRADAAQRDPSTLILELVSRAVDTFSVPLEKSYTTLEECEMRVFGAEKKKSFVVADGYYLKRRASVIKRILKLTADSLNKLSPQFGDQAPRMQEIRDAAEHYLFEADDIHENVQSILNLHLTLESHNTNEVIRVLTLFSVFFLPLNFIAGVYGMNFEHMPELKWSWGYHAVLVLMAIVTVSIYAWFRIRGWLRK